MVEGADQLYIHLSTTFLEDNVCDILSLLPSGLLSLNLSLNRDFFMSLLMRQTNSNKKGFFLSIPFLSIRHQVGDVCRWAECLITKLSFMFHSVILHHTDINTKDKCKTF